MNCSVDNISHFNLEFEKDTDGNPFFAPFPFFFEGIAIKGISCGISSRYAGDMKFEKENQNRQILYSKLNLDSEKVFGLKQIHSRTVLVVDGCNPPQIEADGMVTQDGGIFLSVTIADCLPVFLLDVKTKAFGVVHSGWKGTGIAVNAVNLMMEKWGTDVRNIAAVLGPCIGSCCYSVDEERASFFAGEFSRESVLHSGGEFFLDLKAANIKLLTEAGVSNISVCDDCTFTDERLGSFRREGGQYTRMAAVAGFVR